MTENPQAFMSGQVPLPEELPVLPLKNVVLYPHVMAPILVGQDRSLKLVDAAMQGQRLLVTVCQRDSEEMEPGPEGLYNIGTVATIHQMQRDDGAARLLVHGVTRVRINAYTAEKPFLTATITPIEDYEENETAIEGGVRSVRELFRNLAALIPQLPDGAVEALEMLDDPAQVAFLVAAAVPMDQEDRQDLLATRSIVHRLSRLAELIQREISVREVGQQITERTQQRMNEAQREHFLREQLRSIQKELGGGEGAEAMVEELREKLDALDLPEEVRTEADRELSRLQRIPEASLEHGMVQTWLEWVTHLPWNKLTHQPVDLVEAKDVLDADHYDLVKVKDRILEHLAVGQLREERDMELTDEGDASGSILCLVGPPGTGKTSLGQSIARATGRKFVRVALGGVHDETEIRGHRRTYVGSMPGRIIQALRRAESSDPVMVLDEVDKLGSGAHGDPSAALLEVLDPAQNKTFTDTYLNVPFDLRRVLFVCTANTEEHIPGPLRDRMEVLRIAGYTELEKLQIAKQHLVVKQRKMQGLREDELQLDDEVLTHLIRGYTREAGVRGLDRVIASVARKTARRIKEGGDPVVSPSIEEADELIGPRKFEHTEAERIDRPGVALGLAWTAVGGEIMFIEAALYESDSGKGRVILTGSLGDVMRESAQAALSCLRTRADLIGVEQESFEGKTLHVHVPQGAVPKDGPSAGITMTVAIASAITGRIASADTAMTGEITLRGNVLPIGGLKEKCLAAHRAGIKRVLIPERNLKDVPELPDVLREELDIIPVKSIEEVLEHALTKQIGERAA